MNNEELKNKILNTLENFPSRLQNIRFTYPDNGTGNIQLIYNRLGDGYEPSELLFEMVDHKISSDKYIEDINKHRETVATYKYMDGKFEQIYRR